MERGYEAWKRGEQLALPYVAPRVTDPDKQAALTEAYRLYREGEVADDELPDSRRHLPRRPARAYAPRSADRAGCDAGRDVDPGLCELPQLSARPERLSRAFQCPRLEPRPARARSCDRQARPPEHRGRGDAAARGASARSGRARQAHRVSARRPGLARPRRFARPRREPRHDGR